MTIGKRERGNGRPTGGDGPDERFFRVVIVGGGVAALEAALAVRYMLSHRAAITLLAPDETFVYRPLTVAEPFGIAATHSLPIHDFCRDVGCGHRRDALAAVDPERRVAVTRGGEELAYDALLLAIGTRLVPELRGALTYSGPSGNEAMREVISEIESGRIGSVAFVVPLPVRWPLPLYELALLTAHRAREVGREVSVQLITHEQRPLEIFGHRASDGIAQLLAVSGVRLIADSAATSVSDGSVRLAGDSTLEAERIVALPRHEVEPIPGLRQGPRGFVGTDRNMQVEGLDGVWAAGDVTWFPIKQGGIAAQQADTAASAIAHSVDSSVALEPFRPVLRGAILTGDAPRYLRAAIGRPDVAAASGTAPLWWPPSKVAGRFLGPYLSGHRGELPVPLEDLEPLEGEDPEEAAADHLDAVGLALAAADADARWHDYDGALRWLDAAEQLNLTLPTGYAAKRELWAREAAAGGAA